MLVINIGMLIGKEWEVMLLVGKIVNVVGIFVVLDFVGVGVISYCCEIICELLVEVKFVLICGNVGELVVIVGEEW